MRAITEIEGQLVSLVGRLDVQGSATARDAVQAALAAGFGELVLDLSAVELMDATGLGVLVGAHHRAKQRGRRLVLRDPSPRVVRMLTVTRLDRIIPMQRAAVPA